MRTVSWSRALPPVGNWLCWLPRSWRETPRVAAVLSLFGANDLSVGGAPAKGQFDASMLLGGEASEDAVQAASPLHRITADFPPVFLLHGGDDWLIDPVASLRTYEKLVGLGVTAELHIVANALHEFVGEPRMTEPVVSELARFLDRVLVEPERWSAETAEHNLFAKGPEAVQALMAQLLERDLIYRLLSGPLRYGKDAQNPRRMS